MNRCAKDPAGGRVAGPENGQAGSGRGPAGWRYRGGRRGGLRPGRPGAPEPRPAPSCRPCRRRRRRRRAPEAGGDFLCPPRPRPGRRLRPSLARRPPAPTKRRAEGRGGGAPEGGTGPQAKPTGVSGDGPEGVAAGGTDAWLPGAAGGGPVTRGGGAENRSGLRVAAFPWGRLR